MPRLDPRTIFPDLAFDTLDAYETFPLYESGKDEFGHPVIRHPPHKWYVQAQASNGQRWNHFKLFDRQADAVTFAAFVQHAYLLQGLNLDYWEEQRPVYGSEAYVSQGCEEETIQWEQDNDRF
jgi:hypothetical protein